MRKTEKLAYTAGIVDGEGNYILAVIMPKVEDQPSPSLNKRRWRMKTLPQVLSELGRNISNLNRSAFITWTMLWFVAGLIIGLLIGEVVLG